MDYQRPMRLLRFARNDNIGILQSSHYTFMVETEFHPAVILGLLWIIGAATINPIYKLLRVQKSYQKKTEKAM